MTTCLIKPMRSKILSLQQHESRAFGGGPGQEACGSEAGGPHRARGEAGRVPGRLARPSASPHPAAFPRSPGSPNATPQLRPPSSLWSRSPRPRRPLPPRNPQLPARATGCGRSRPPGRRTCSLSSLFPSPCPLFRGPVSWVERDKTRQF